MMNHSPLRGRRILLTGGTGFIGTALAEALAARGDDAPSEIVLFDNRRRNAGRYVDYAKFAVPVKLIDGEITDAAAVERGMEGCDAVVHLAAIAGVDSVDLKPTVTMEVNTLGTYHVMEVARKLRPRRVLCFSTSEVYGPYVYRGDEKTMTSQGPVGVFRWCYAVSKLAAEHWAHAYGQDHALEVVTIRPFNVYGPRQVGEGAVRKFVLAALRNDPLFINGDGNQIRAWCYIDDMVRGTIAALTSDRAPGHAFNIGNPRATVTVLGLAERIVASSGSSSQIRFRSALQADVEIRVPSIDSARELLGYDPEVSLDDGLKRTIEWFRRCASS